MQENLQLITFICTSSAKALSNDPPTAKHPARTKQFLHMLPREEARVPKAA